ncbi:T9SS type A sorting domain-containing protein [candidate division KSB1 bacterium]|nr:T9SS type A sorting domain-containing protein [candidate division KSB1 bacterium]
MKKNSIIVILFFALVSSLNAQDYVNVTFRHYATNTNVVRAFIPGSFNGWGPNNSGVIAQGAVSQMDYVDSPGLWKKKIRLRVGSTHNYKLHEHYNDSGSDWQWFTDPLNPDVNYDDNNNSIITIKKVMLFQVLPRDGNIISEQQPEIAAGVFTTENDSILLNQSTISLDGEFLSTFANNLIPELSLLKYTLPDLANGNHFLVLNILTKNGESVSDSINFTYQGAAPEIADLPEGVIDGINYVDDSTVTLVLHAPYYKKFVYVIGDFNNWQVDQNYFMKQTPDRQRYWLTLSGLDANTEYRFQYFVDGEIRIADPYAEKILDPWNDRYISNSTYPNLIPYPEGLTSEIVSSFQINQEEYQWQVTDFERPPKEKLVIYELLVRDFIAAHDYKTLTDTLDYFERLGINAIELMPVNEFEGNESWGYNPSFYFALDKYYGHKNDLKMFVDECHKRGIAVLGDLVLNHSYGQSPLVRLFFENGKPSSSNPWYNVDNNFQNPDAQWGYDFDHESTATQRFVDRVNDYWLTEFLFDGFRFDFTKGIGNNVKNKYSDPWGGKYDADRIRLLKRMADQIWLNHPTAYVILEHFADNTEEIELSNHGMMLWGNSNDNYNEATMGWNENGKSDFSWGFYKKRGWSNPHLVTYMESHDEERLMNKNLKYGNSSGDYSIKYLSTALDRIKLAASFFLTLPGPKMIWQFGELGYDYSIDYNGRVGNKPIRWDYYEKQNRKNLYRTFSALLKLRNENEAFTSNSSIVSLSVSGAIKRINISHDSLNVSIIGNFGVTTSSIDPKFQHTGMWYNYFFADSIDVVNTNENIQLNPGEFFIYTDKKLESPGSGMLTGVVKERVELPHNFKLFQNYPNPFNPTTTIFFELPTETEVLLDIYNIQGQKIRTLVQDKLNPGIYQKVWDGKTGVGTKAVSGIYLYKFKAGDFIQTKKMLLRK